MLTYLLAPILVAALSCVIGLICSVVARSTAPDLNLGHSITIAATASGWLLGCVISLFLNI